MAKKLKVKKNVVKISIISFIVILFLGIGIYSYIKVTEKINYEKTYEFKLINKGYDKDTAIKITKNFKDKEIDYILEEKINDIYLNLANDKFFIYDKFYEYLDYQKEHDAESIRNIVEKVNTNTHKEYYTDPVPTDTEKGNLMLVNKYHYLESDFTPENLVDIPQTYAYGDIGSQKATEETYNAFLNMWNASHEAGFYLMVNSSYRTFEKQQSVYDDYKKMGGTDYADKYAARPGYSEHQTGLTLDIFEKGTSSKTFPDTDSYKWLVENAHKYGFIQRYPTDKINITGYDFESWHYRYVGVEAATYIYENGITFDEYYAYFVK